LVASPESKAMELIRPLALGLPKFGPVTKLGLTGCGPIGVQVAGPGKVIGGVASGEPDGLPRLAAGAICPAVAACASDCRASIALRCSIAFWRTPAGMCPSG